MKTRTPHGTTEAKLQAYVSIEVDRRIREAQRYLEELTGHKASRSAAITYLVNTGYRTHQNNNQS